MLSYNAGENIAVWLTVWPRLVVDSGEDIQASLMPCLLLLQQRVSLSVCHWWNNLPSYIKERSTITNFMKHLKTFLFTEVYMTHW